LERDITPLGIRFMNIQYRNVWTKKDLMNNGYDGQDRTRKPRKVRIKVDPRDLGWISYERDGAWVTVPGPREFRGMDLDTWIEIGDRNAR
ncbi:Mu transposase C-terminal domain-containing protein, partial [Enterobacter hormaechei]|nr:Mu transposase C-terminal domain-containing protein [Enterobacter hormaechei]